MRQFNLVNYFTVVLLFSNIIFTSAQLPETISEKDAKNVGTFIDLAQREGVQSCRSDGANVILTLKDDKGKVKIPITKN